MLRQMAMVLDGGITVEDGIDAIVSQVEDQEYKKVLQEIQQKVENGIALSKAMKETNLYDEYLIFLILLKKLLCIIIVQKKQRQRSRML